MKRFKVSSNNSNKLTAQDFEVLMTKLAAVTPPSMLQPLPKIKIPNIKDLMEGLERASKIHGSGGRKTGFNAADNAGLAYLVTKTIDTLGTVTGLGSLLGGPLQLVSLIALAMKNLKPTLQKMIVSKNPIFQNFDTEKYEIKRYASVRDLTAPDIITKPYAIKGMTLAQILESYKGSSLDLDGAWVDSNDGINLFKNPDDVLKIERMIKKMDSNALLKIAGVLTVASVPLGIVISEGIRNHADKKARESATGQQVKQDAITVAPLTTDPSNMSESLRDRLKNTAKPKDKLTTQKYPNRN
jgi:hypothetical protein